MAAGDTKTINIAAANAYGPHHPEGLQQVPRDQLPPNLEIAEGIQLEAQPEKGGRMMLTVVSVTEESVTLDANHPLAGKDLTFEIELVEIR